MNETILVVDDEPGVRFALVEAIEDAGYRTLEAPNGAAAWTVMEREEVAAVVTDLMMPGGDGMTLLERCSRDAPRIPVIMITARGSERVAVQALRAGAYDYIAKPFELDEVLHTLQRAVELHRLRGVERQAAAERICGHEIVAQSRGMRRVLQAVERVARRNVTVLVTGETGAGKEIVGTLIHAQSERAHGPLVRFNCAAMPETLADSALFGVKKGAYTGADRDREGFLRRAHRGTLVLDEVGELPLKIQAKLLRTLQEGEIQPVGASAVEKVDVRVVACTHRDLKECVSSGQFRADLYYRLAVVELHVPALRDRVEDIAPLVDVFRRRYMERFGLEDVWFSQSVVRMWERAPWDGNVRELENAVARALALCDEGEVGLGDVVGVDGRDANLGDQVSVVVGEGSFRVQMSAFEREVLRVALEKADGNRSQAARALGLSRTTFLDKLKRTGLWTPS